MKRIVNALEQTQLGKRAFVVFVLCAVTAIVSPAQSFSTLINFDNTDGAQPNMVLVQGTDGNLYGTTPGGGAYGYGTVFKITAGGTLTTLYNFCGQKSCPDGYGPSGLVQATDGDFYGTTSWGGTGSNAGCNGNGQVGCGTVFKVTAEGTLTTLHSFSGAEGSAPNGLVQATDGDFYGTNSQGGANNGAGTAFKITAAGKLTTLYNFCSQTNCTDGATPTGTLVQATDGDFYGTTWTGGSTCYVEGGPCGTVFKITRAGKLATLVTVGGYLSGGVLQATDGNFYGTAARSGAIFKLTPSGALTTLGTACCYLYAGLVQATDGNFYGTTYVGGANNNSICEDLGCGSVFQITPGGTLTTLYNFCSQPNCTDGYWPLAGLMQSTNGNLYGTTVGGGTAVGAYDFYGSIFSLGVGLGRFVEMLPTSGRVGSAAKILGTNLTGATGVSFNGTPAVFKVVSSSEITTRVPAGASSGTVQVITPSGTLSSKVPFRVP